MRRLLGSLVCIFCLGGLLGCSDEENGTAIPPYIADLLVVYVDGEGMLKTVLLDDGTEYDISRQALSANVEDTAVRCLATYTLEGNELRLHGLTDVFSQPPHTPEELLKAADGTQLLDSLPRDPVKVVSVWKSGGYVNMQLGVLTTGGRHGYAFCEDSVGHYSLVHLRETGDAESYTERVYLSMPVPEGVPSISFSIQTYDSVYTRNW